MTEIRKMSYQWSRAIDEMPRLVRKITNSERLTESCARLKNHVSDGSVSMETNE